MMFKCKVAMCSYFVLKDAMAIGDLQEKKKVCEPLHSHRSRFCAETKNNRVDTVAKASVWANTEV